MNDKKIQYKVTLIESEYDLQFSKTSRFIYQNNLEIRCTLVLSKLTPNIIQYNKITIGISE